MDLLENEIMNDVVVLSVVLEEVKNKNLSTYNRLRAVIDNPLRHFFVFSNENHKDTYVKSLANETPNDRNDRAIRVASQWYQHHLGAAKVVLITNDNDNRRKAREDGIVAETVDSYVQSLGKPELLDLVARNDAMDVDTDDIRPNKKAVVYGEHKVMSEIAAGLHNGRFHQGKLRVNRYNPFEAYVGSESVGSEILILGRQDMNRAFDGDVVAVELLPQSSWAGSEAGKIADRDDEEEEEPVGLVPASADDAPRNLRVDAVDGKSAPSRPTGRVVGIIKRNWRQYCGSIEPMKMPGGSGGTVQALFVSADRRIPKIRIQTRQLANLIDKRIMVSVDSWEPTSRYPNGHYVRTIGEIGDRATESDVLLLENDINSRPFSEAVLACLPPLPWSFSEQEHLNNQRQDLRHIRVFSVDPLGCRDIDDALHCTLLPDGHYEVGVHIADVTNFVLPNLPLDEEASQRGTSVYLVERRIDMLPKPLTEDICSLRADVERLAFSCIWVMNSEAEIESVRFTKSVIKSCAAMSYLEAQTRMDDSRLTDGLTTDLRNMNRLAKIMRLRRIERGALTLASPEVKFEIDTETHDPLDVGMYQVREANQMVEEFMLAANMSVAAKILEHFPSCSLLRRHPEPTPQMFEPLLRTAAAVGVTLDISSSKALADALDHAVGDDPYFNKLIRIMATRCMTQAVYFCSGELSYPEYLHYGLAAPLYTHFTSPIRRYADVIVHRLLAAALGLNTLPEKLRDASALTSLSDNLNYRHRNAQMAGRASVELHTVIFFKKRPTDEEARIVKIRSNGFIVFVPKYGIEGPVYLVGKEAKQTAVDGMWVVDDENQIIRSSDGSRTFKVLSSVRVHIEVVEPQPNRPKLQLSLTM
nr:exosome complex exonuclease RRP44 homolog A-like isoform X2 [Physcomitrium patens]XP_024399336.1 exosome complex exonuclease RRP44 homolog A-like isoform X2 [Physcomitrium patens]|eukprot:XP_024399335.1 exosome complex exonuclease RRP44 homolog A-like isoform X2 [Physcomitrella patens]